jgi:tRNA pseudouridine38-40 synthase
VAWPVSLLDADGRAGEVVVAPAHGLTLTGVDYPQDDLLAQRAERTRRRRSRIQ